MNPDAHPPRDTAALPAHRPPASADEGAPAVGVQDPKLTAVLVARQLEELARALNYATRTAGPRLEYAADVYEVLGSLHAALAKLPQACGQLADFLARHDSAGAFRAERGFPHAGRPTLAVEAASFKLGQAAAAANVTATALGRAQEAISGLSHAEPGEPLAHRHRPTFRPQPADHGAPGQGQAIER